MYCTLGKSIGIGVPSHWLEPHIQHKCLLFGNLSHHTGLNQGNIGTTWPMFNVNTPFQRLRHIYIPFGKTISA